MQIAIFSNKLFNKFGKRCSHTVKKAKTKNIKSIVLLSIHKLIIFVLVANL